MKCERCNHNLWSSYNPDNDDCCECGIGEDDFLSIEDGCKLKGVEARKLARLNKDMIGRSYYGYDFVDNEDNFIPLERMFEYLKAKQDFNKATKEYNKYREHLMNKYNIIERKN